MPWFAAGAAVFLYLHLFIIPFTPIWIGGDQTVYLTNAIRMWHGEAIYRDFFHFLLPGTEMVYLSLFGIFGVRMWIPNAMLVILGVGLTWLVVAISKQVLKGWTVFLPALLLLTVAYRNMLNGTHHWFSTAAVLGAIWVVLNERTPARLVSAGALCGLATCFTTTKGIAAVAGLCAFLLIEWQRGDDQAAFLRKCVPLMVGFLTSVIAANLYFVMKAGLGAVWYSTVTFVLKYYRADVEANSWSTYLAGWPTLPPWRHLPAFASWLLIYAMLPLVYVVFLMRNRRANSPADPQVRNRLMMISIVGLALVAGAAPAPNFFRLFSISPPAFIVFVWLITEERFKRALLPPFWAFGLLLMFTEPWSNHRGWRDVLDLPSGRTAFLSKDRYNQFAWLLGHTHQGEFLFDASRLPSLYFPLDLRDPAQVTLLTTTDYTRPEQVQNLLESLENHKVRLVYWSADLDRPEDPLESGDHLGPLRAYLRGHYRVIKILGDDQIWERKDY